MMPQKRNPDIPELVRGKAGRTIGHLIAILTMLKSLPLAYNRDLQEDKENLFDVFDTVGASLHALTNFLAETEFDKVRMRESAEDGLMTATDLADFLTTRGIPFRTAHGIVQQISERSGGDPHNFKRLAEEALVEHWGRSGHLTSMSWRSTTPFPDGTPTAAQHQVPSPRRPGRLPPQSQGRRRSWHGSRNRSRPWTGSWRAEAHRPFSGTILSSMHAESMSNARIMSSLLTMNIVSV